MQNGDEEHKTRWFPDETLTAISTLVAELDVKTWFGTLMDDDENHVSS